MSRSGRVRLMHSRRLRARRGSGPPESRSRTVCLPSPGRLPISLNLGRRARPPCPFEMSRLFFAFAPACINLFAGPNSISPRAGALCRSILLFCRRRTLRLLRYGAGLLRPRASDFPDCWFYTDSTDDFAGMIFVRMKARLKFTMKHHLERDISQTYG